MLQTVKLFSLNAVLSAGIGLIVGVVAILALGPNASPAILLATSAAIGAIIGTLARGSVLLLHRFFTANLVAGYGLALLVTGLLTLATAYPLNWSGKLAMLAVVEPLAFLAMFCNIRYFHRLNDGLKRKQATLRPNPKKP